MPRRVPPRRRSAREWAVRGLLAVAAAAVGLAGVTETLAYALRNGDVTRAHALAPGNGRISALFSQNLSGPDATAADRVRADRMAREALRRDPTAVTAVTTLGLNAQVRGDAAVARRLFTFAGALSRRDLQTQVWAIEDAVSRGDVAGALHHYDTALRTSRSAPDLLFPVLASAIADPAIRSALAETLARKPGWRAGFVSHVADNGPDPRATARLFLDLGRMGDPVPEDARAVVIGSLITRDFLADAWPFYASGRPGADRRISRDPRFTAELGNPSAFDWTPINDAGVTTSVQRGDTGGVFDFAAPASVGGPALQQMQVLPPGDYRIEGRSIGIDQPEASRPYWTLTCRDGRELGRVVMPNSVQADGVFAGEFRVPAGCPLQTLTLVIRSSEAVSGVAGQVDRIQLRPAR